MIGGNVERLEVVEVILDLGPGRDLESRLHENALDAQSRAGHRMDAARFLTAPRQGHIDGAARELGIERFTIEPLATRLDRRVNDDLGVVDLLSGRGPLLGRQLAECLELLGQQALLAKQTHAHLVQVGQSA